MIQIGRVAHTRPHLLADTVEVAIAFGDYSSMSQNDILSLMKQSPRADSELLPSDVEDLDDDDNPDGMDGTEISARDAGYIEECFRQMQYREETIGDLYPFKVDGELITYKAPTSELGRLYLLLLACSRSRTFKVKGAPQRLADCFEEICARCLTGMISPFGTTLMFGPNSPERGTTFAGGLTAALPKLAKLMGMGLKTGWEKNFGTSGDASIDLVGIYNFDDSASGFKVVIGQCAAMEDEKDWMKKRQEAQLSFRSGSFSYLVEPDAILFVPACYRQPDGEWINSDFVSNVVTIDRVRIMKILQKMGFDDVKVTDFFDRAGIKLAA